jgi:alginate O-acetyltransferase complex protein AlgI
MLFNSYEFILLFLPLTLAVFFLLGERGHHRVAIGWLVAASLFFYGWWNPAYLLLILISIIANYLCGIALSNHDKWERRQRRQLLILGVAANLSLLGYYKYANFFIDNMNTFFGTGLPVEHILLPLAISFFTFQQISYLVDAYENKTREYGFLHYALFVTFFPQLIAGPIVHHREMLYQFASKAIYKFNHTHMAVGLTIFIIGLFKKVVVADALATYATMAFSAASSHVVLSLFEAWRGALAYSFQLYFDFSGYSDMAIGLAYMFGILLPLNFNSPYKATNIIDFWSRWHMTLSRFLKDYVYIPLGGNRRGARRRYINLMLTMLLGGLWHGAAWTFVLWGGLHGLFLVINHGWHALRRRLGHDLVRSGWLATWGGRLLTFVAVTIGWVFFRAENSTVAFSMLQGMAGLQGIVWPDADIAAPLKSVLIDMGWEFMPLAYFAGTQDLVIIGLVLAAIWLLPNTQQLLASHRPTLATDEVVTSGKFQWRPSPGWLVVIFLMGLISILKLSEMSEFLYFQF